MTKEDILNSIDPVFQSEIPSDVWDKAAVLKAMQQYADQQSVWFGTWYSGMDSEKVQSAYNRFLKEQGKFKQSQQPLKPLKPLKP